MPRNPRADPAIEASYRGYAIRAVAHRNLAETFTATVEILDGQRADGMPIYAYAFEIPFAEPDAALQFAAGKAREAVDNLLNLGACEPAQPCTLQ
jgi:hypothetical protein